MKKIQTSLMRVVIGTLNILFVSTVIDAVPPCDWQDGRLFLVLEVPGMDTDQRLKRIEELLEQGASVCARNKQGMTPLHKIACEYQQAVAHRRKFELHLLYTRQLMNTFPSRKTERNCLAIAVLLQWYGADVELVPEEMQEWCREVYRTWLKSDSYGTWCEKHRRKHATPMQLLRREVGVSQDTWEQMVTKRKKESTRLSMSPDDVMQEQQEQNGGQSMGCCTIQ